MGDEIERFAWVDRWLARGGQPSSAALEHAQNAKYRVNECVALSPLMDR
jgi:hypothetical protein